MNAQCSGNLAQIVVMLGRMERLKERTRESVSEGEIVCGGGGGRGKGERGREGGEGENEDSNVPPGQSKLASANKYRSLRFIKPSAQHVSF